MAEGATVKSDLPLVHGQLVTVKGGNLSNLASHTSVAYVSPNRPVRGSLDHAVTAVNGELAFARGWNGTGVGIVVIDSGISSAYDLNSDDNQSSRIAYDESFVPGDFSSGDPFGHGTHIAGIIAGNAYASSMSCYQVSRVLRLLGVVDYATNGPASSFRRLASPPLRLDQHVHCVRPSIPEI